MSIYFNFLFANFDLFYMETNRTYLARFAKVIKAYKSANGGLQIARYVLLRVMLVDEPDRQWFTRFFRKQAHIDWLETTCLISMASKGDNRQLFLAHDCPHQVNSSVERHCTHANG